MAGWAEDGGGGAALATISGPGAAAPAARRAAFAALRPVCTRLLQLRGDAAAMRAALDDLRAAIVAAPPQGLAACWDYVTFPLFIALDSAASIRSQKEAAAAAAAAGASGRAQGGGGGGRGGASGVPGGATAAAPVAAAGSDVVAEGLLTCLAELSRRAPPGEADQLVPLLEKLLPLLQIGPAFLSEEVGRAGVAAAAALLMASLRDREMNRLPNGASRCV
jgi:hypothetical protein